MHMEGNIREKSAAFFESPGFRTFNFALLERLNTIEHTTRGFAELDLKEPATQKKLKTSLKKLSSVVTTLQQLLEISSSFKTAELQTLHPEKIFEHLHLDYTWPRVDIKTYQSLLVSVPDNVLVSLLNQIFAIENISLHALSIMFRRRQSSVVVRVLTPKANWLDTHLVTILRQNDVCLPLQSDSLEVILLRAMLCVLQNYEIELSINTRQPNCLYIYLPSARQLQVFAQAATEE